MPVMQKTTPGFGRTQLLAVVSDGQLAFLYFAVFCVFYLLQTSGVTSNADATVYSLRSLSAFPIFDYAFLPESDPPFRLLLPNYHLGHTLILWGVYQLVPQSLAHSVWPAGFVSAISGACTVAFSYLIWRELKFERDTASASAIVAGLIPTIWYQSTIGELYALQLAVIIVFVYFFLRQCYLISAMAFLVAVLISPLSGLAFSLLLLATWNRRNLLYATLIGCGCLALYLAIFRILESNIFATFDALNAEVANRSVGYNAGKLLLVILANLNFMLLYFIAGTHSSWRLHRRTITLLALAMIPHIALIYISTEFMRERGCFLLVLLWSLSLPLGIGIVALSRASKLSLLPLALSVIVTVTLWTFPHGHIGEAQRHAGLWLRHNAEPQTRLLGDWDNGVGITVARYGWSENILATRFFEARNADTQDVLRTGESSLIVTVRKKSWLRRSLAQIPLPWFELQTYLPEQSISRGKLTKIYDNHALSLYRWDRT